MEISFSKAAGDFSQYLVQYCPLRAAYVHAVPLQYLARSVAGLRIGEPDDGGHGAIGSRRLAARSWKAFGIRPHPGDSHVSNNAGGDRDFPFPELSSRQLGAGWRLLGFDLPCCGGSVGRWADAHSSASLGEKIERLRITLPCRSSGRAGFRG